MSRFGKAFLCSALVFPGTGHLLLKKYGLALVLLLPSVVALYTLLQVSYSRAQEIADKIVAGEVAPDLNAITALVTASPPPEMVQQLSIASYVLLGCWILGMLDCLRLRHQANQTR